MATVTGFTAAHTQAIEDATIVDAEIDGSGDLIFTRHDSSTFNAGSSLPAIPSASTILPGVVELATNAEAVAGTDAVRAVTPAAAKAIIDALILDGIADVTITSHTTNDVLQWNGTAWVNRNFLTVTGDVTAAKGRFGGNGPSDAVWIGDDVVLADANVSNAFVVKGQQDSNQAKIYLGSGLDTAIFRNGANQLKTDSNFVAGGTLFHSGGPSMGQGNKLGVSGFGGSSSGSGSTAAGPESGLNTSVSAGSNSITLENNHIYRLFVLFNISDNINSSYSLTIVRLYTSGGIGITGWVIYTGFNGHISTSHSQIVHVKRVSGSNLTTGFGFTVQRYNSGVAGTCFLDSATVSCDDMGLVSDHSGFAAIAGAI